MDTEAWLAAASEGDTSALQSMIDREVDVDATNEAGETALLKAAGSGVIEAVRLLLKAGANPNRADARHQTPLGQAIWAETEEIAAILLAAGADPEGYGHGAMTPLMVAVNEGNRGIVDRLLAAGADVRARTTEGGTALHRAAGQGRTRIARLLIERGAEVNAATEDGFTPLHLAIRQAKMGTVVLLLSSGADVNARTRDGRTPLLEAVLHGRPRVVQVFVDAKADPNVPFQGHDALRDELEKGATCLMVAAHQGKLEVVEQLLAAGANASATNDRGRTALEVAEQQGHADVIDRLRKVGGVKRRGAAATLGPRLIRSAAAGRCDDVEALLAQGVDPNFRDPKPVEQGRTALIAASAKGHLECVAVLLVGGAEVDLATIENNWLGPTATALLAAAREGHAGVVVALLKGGAAVDWMNDRGETALFEAAHSGHAEIVRILLEAGADATLRPHDAERSENPDAEEPPDALTCAIEQAHDDVVEVLLNSGVRADGSALVAAAACCRTAVIGRLLAAGVDIQARGATGKTALHAVCAPATKVVESDPRINVIEVEDESRYLSQAARRQLECVRMLLEACADVHARDGEGRTPLHVAARMESAVTYVHAKDLDGDARHTHNEVDTSPIVRLLLQHGADPNARDDGGITPLMLAARVNPTWSADPVPVMRALVDGGADVNIESREGRTALFATYDTGLGAIELLVATGSDVNHRDARGQTPLIAACEAASGRGEIPRALVAAGADVSARDGQGMTALDVARRQHDGETIALLESAGARTECTADIELCDAIEARDRDGVEAALRAGAKPHAPYPRRGGDAFGLALRYAPVEIVEALIAADADVNRDYPQPDVGAPLLIALERARTEGAEAANLQLIERLLEAGAHPNARSRKGWSPLTYAGWMRNEGLVARLTEAGAMAAGDIVAGDFLSTIEYRRASAAEAFQRAKAIVSGHTRKEPMPIEWLPGAHAYFVTAEAETDAAMREGDHPSTARFGVEWATLDGKVLHLIRMLRPELAPLGASVLDMGRPIGCGPSGKFLALLPTTDHFSMLAACGPSPGGDHGDDGGLFLPDVVAWFRGLASQWPFTLLGSGRDFVSIEFDHEIEAADALEIARRTEDFSSDTITQGVGTLAKQIVEQRRIYFWWD